MIGNQRRWLIVVGSVLGGLAVLVIGALLIAQSSWFGNFVRQKLVSTIEDSTGGKVELDSFEFDPWHLTVRVRNFVLHGTEPANVPPLAKIALLELHLKLFSGIGVANILQIAYVGVSDPHIDFLVNPDGTTNLPSPKVKRQPSQTSPLETVVNLAIGEFRITNGLVLYSQRSANFSAQGRDLLALLNFNTFTHSYEGHLLINPLRLSLAKSQPLDVQVSVPLLIEKNSVNVSGARLATNASEILINAGIRNLNSPVITARVNANISLPEMAKSFDIPVDTSSPNLPRALTAELNARYSDQSGALELQTANLALGQTRFEASGTLQPSANQAIQFRGNLALDQLARLAKLQGTQLSGALQLHGRATIDAQKNYAVNGNLNSRDLSVVSGGTKLADVSLSSPFHADPYLISLDGLKLSALGGTLNSKIFLEKMRQLNVEGHLNNFSIPVLTQIFAGHSLGYDGVIGGALQAKDDLKAKGATGLSAQSQLQILPGSHGVPINGRIFGRYNGASGIVALENSFIALPHSRLDLSGNINHQLNLNLSSRNLNDFLPAANFGAAQPAHALPITLQSGGVANLSAQVQGNLSDPRIAAQASMTDFLAGESTIQRLAMNLVATQSGASVTNGEISGKGLQSNFDMSIGLDKWKPLSTSALAANLNLPNSSLAALLALTGQQSIPASGTVSAQVHVNGTYGDPLGNASLQLIKGEAYNQPFDNVQANVNLAHQLITLNSLEIDAAGGQLMADGTFRHPSDSFQVGHAEFRVTTKNIQLANLQPLQQRSPGVAGAIQLVADGAADIRTAAAGTAFQIDSINTDFSAHGLKVNNQPAGDLIAQAHTSNGALNYQVRSDFAGSNVRVDGATSLAKDYATRASVSIQNLSVEKVLAVAGQTTIPASGTLSLNGDFNGTIQNPDATANLSLSKAVIYAEPLDHLTTRLHYSNTLVDVPSLTIDAPAGSLSAHLQYNHKAGNFNIGQVQLQVTSSDLDLFKIKHLTSTQPGLAGGLKLTANIAGNLSEKNGQPQLLLSRADADIDAHSLRANNRSLGDLRLTSQTVRNSAHFTLVSKLAQADISATGETALISDYDTHAKLTFSNIHYANIAPYLQSDNTTRPGFDVLVEGQATVDGPVTKVDALTGRVQLNQLVAKTQPHSTINSGPVLRTVELQNAGPIVLSLAKSVLKIQQFNIEGAKTTLKATGAISLKTPDAALGVNINGNADLGILQNADRDFYSSGSINLDATVRGSFAKPLLNGKVELHNVNVNYTGFSNGLSNTNGVILLNGATANIETLTGQSGGGKVSLAGFAGLGPNGAILNLHATASKVRTRYSGVSITSNAEITLAGNTNRSTLSGNVSIQRLAYSFGNDVGSLLSNASVPPSIPAAPSPLLSGMRLDVRIVTAPDVRIVTDYAEKLSLTTNLSLQGTAQDPGMIGHIIVTNGNLVFFGNTYAVNTGSVDFYNPNAIEPILNLSLETVAQGVDVTLGVRGPVNDLKLSYRSDPPLTFEQIIQLLATNTTPADPTIAAQQPTPPQQSLSQMGESAVLGQAIANPLASRVRRVFGLSQFKIDPSLAAGQASARVTLQEKITNNLTFTYIQDVTQTNSEIVRVQLDLTPKISVVALRDFNGNVSVEMFYKFQKR